MLSSVSGNIEFICDFDADIETQSRRKDVGLVANATAAAQTTQRRTRQKTPSQETTGKKTNAPFERDAGIGKMSFYQSLTASL